MGQIIEPGSEPIPGYRIIRKLGQGGFGEVWEAEAPGGVRVAIKVIPLDPSKPQPELRALEMMRNIRHPHLLDIQFSVRVGDSVLIGMPLCDQSLWDRLGECTEDECGIPVDELLGYMEDLAKAVDFLNEPRHPNGEGKKIGIQHRDIKPQNIFLVGGSVRLADFGLSKFLVDNVASHTGTMSPKYVSPEALQGLVAPQSDQYSVGITYVELRTGVLPFGGYSISEIIYKHLIEPPDLSALPPEERSIVARALAKEPAQRWANCREFVTELRSAIRRGEEKGESVVRSHLHARSSARSPVRPRPDGSNFKIDPGSVPPSPEGSQTLRLPASGVFPAMSAPPTPSADDLQSSREGPPSGTGWRSVKETPSNRPGGRRLIPFALAGVLAAVLAGVAILSGVFNPRKPEPPPVDDPPLVKNQPPLVKPIETPPPITTEKVAVGPPAPPPAPAPKAPKSATPEPKSTAASVETTSRPIAPPDVPKAKPKDPPRPRPWRSEGDVLGSIRDDLKRLPEPDREYQRYFTFTNLYNNPEVSADDLRLYRAALAKLLNTLSWEKAIAVPESIDPGGFVLRIDLRKLGWKMAPGWEEVLKAYPYGLIHDGPNDPLRRVCEEIGELSSDALPAVRADWFVAQASRPPLFDSLLRLPATAADLERKLGVDLKVNFMNGKLARAAYSRPAVSGQGQVAERHEGAWGAYWRTYDFQLGRPASDYLRLPLGPAFEGNPFGEWAFSPAGGTMLFELRNGLLASMIVDREGRRIDAAPSDVASDPRGSAKGSPLRNGGACLACHRGGPLPLKDEVRQAAMMLAGDSLRKVLTLYPEPSSLEVRRKADEVRYLAALREATRGLLKGETDEPRDFRDLPEPIDALARRFERPLRLDDVTHELGIARAGQLAEKVKAVPRLERLGFGALLRGEPLTRDAWSKVFDLACGELDVGTPFQFSSSPK